MVASAIVSLVGSSKAAHAQTTAAQKASDTELAMYNQNKAILSPYAAGGLGAYTKLNQLLGIGGDAKSMQETLASLPGYQFTLQQGLKSAQNSAAARGLGVSGAALKGAANYATGLANSTYGNYANQLLGSAQIGENAGGALAGVGATTAAQIGSNQIGAGNAQAAFYNSLGTITNNLFNPPALTAAASFLG